VSDRPDRDARHKRIAISEIERWARYKRQRHPQARKLRRAILSLLRDGYTTQEIADSLNASGLRTVTGRPWRGHALRAYMRQQGLGDTPDRKLWRCRAGQIPVVLDALRAGGAKPGDLMTAAVLAARLVMTDEGRRAFQIGTMTPAVVARVESALIQMVEDGQLFQVRLGVYQLPKEGGR